MKPSMSRALGTAAVLAALLGGQAPPALAITNTNHPKPYADLLNGPMWGGVDPRGIATNATNWLSSMGYQSFNDNDNTDAKTAVGPAYAMDDSVFVVFGHAMGGQIAVEKKGVVSVITADSRLGLSPDFTSRGAGANTIRADLYSYPTNYWNRMKLAMWFGCETGLDGNSSYKFHGNLVDEAVSDMGADSSIGYRYLIYYSPNQPDLYEDAFFHALYDYYGTPGTVQQAADAGVANVAWWYGGGPTYYGFGNPYIKYGPGIASVKIRPAAYGNP